MLRTLSRTAAATLVAGTALSLAGSPAQAAPKKTCPTHTTEIASNGISKFWSDHGKLWSCTTYGGRKPQNRRLGPWTKQSQINPRRRTGDGLDAADRDRWRSR